MKDMITFVKTRCKAGDFGSFVDLVGEQASFVVAIEILSWLKRQKRFRNEKGLELNLDHSWCQELSVLLKTDLSLSRLFETADERLQFRSEINLLERLKVRNLADSEYQPVVRTESL
ncbi:hypothetical protein NA78x_004277 [Anatilimnocola sp. NA78]|uniref:hypothetical protein n=1 Tax=Anatilimnocola sp. NA78 TaxID=3415683 RepID=UPI003CE528F5